MRLRREHSHFSVIQKNYLFRVLEYWRGVRRNEILIFPYAEHDGRTHASRDKLLRLSLPPGMRMGIHFCRLAMSRPAKVRDAAFSLELFWHLFAKFADSARRLYDPAFRRINAR